MLITRIRLSPRTAAVLAFSSRALQTLCPRKWPAAHAQVRESIEGLCMGAGIAPWPGMQWRVEKNTLVLF